MSTSPLPYRTLGFSMQRRSARRQLVVGTYAALAAVSGLAFWMCVHSSPWTFRWAVYGPVLVTMFVFGGQGRYGLVKPFLNKPPRDGSPKDELIGLELTPLSAGRQNNRSWQNDERELSRRDRAHYSAYQVLCLGYLPVLVLSALCLHPPRWASVTVLLEGVLLAAIAGVVLSVTLPAALILWNEPDMLPEAEGAR